MISLISLFALIALFELAIHFLEKDGKKHE